MNKNPHSFIQSATLKAIYETVTQPPPYSDELLIHADDCVQCANRIKEARKNDVDTLSSKEKIELDLGIKWLKHQIENFKK